MMGDEWGFVVLSNTTIKLRFCHVFVSEFLCVVVLRIALLQCGNTVRRRRILHLSHNAFAFIQVYGWGLCLRNLLKYGETPHTLRHALWSPIFFEITFKNYIHTIHTDTVGNRYRRFGASIYMQQNPSWESNRSSACQEIPSFLWNPEGSLPHSQNHATGPFPEHDQSSPCPHPTSWRSVLILSSHLRLGRPSGVFPSGNLTKTLYAPSLSPLHVFSREWLFITKYVQWATWNFCRC